MSSGVGRVAVLLGLALVAGCSSVGITRVKAAPARSANCNLEVFTSEQEVKRPFEVLCLIDSRTGTTAFHDKTAAAAIEHAKPQACGCGADAILISALDTEGPGWGTWGQGKAILKAIRFTDK